MSLLALGRFHCNPNFFRCVPPPSELKAATGPPRCPPRPYVGLAKKITGKHGSCNTSHHNVQLDSAADPAIRQQFPDFPVSICTWLSLHFSRRFLARRWGVVGTSLARRWRRHFVNGDSPSVAPVRPPTGMATPRNERKSWQDPISMENKSKIRHRD